MHIGLSPGTTIAHSVAMPLLGLGTWALTGQVAYKSVRTALEIGYRHVGTATSYGNEDRVGQAVRDSGLQRGEFFVTTKMPAHGAGHERRSLEASLLALGLEYVDLWLIHGPPGNVARPDVWQRFIQARESGLTRAIGVSNYSLSQIDELILATGAAPAVNQVRWGPAHFDAATLDGHRRRGVVLEGWSPFKSTDMAAQALTEIAAAHDKTSHQVVLRWHIQHGVVVIPKSSRRERMAINFDVLDFHLDAEEMARIDGPARSS